MELNDMGTKDTGLASSLELNVTKPGYTLTWENLGFSVNVKKETKQIIQAANGIVYPSELCAVMGPSGAGKSTLLDLLCNRIKPSTGSIKLQGAALDSSFKHCSAYVQQQDTLMGNLSVQENVFYSALLRLPSSMSKAAISKKVDEVLQEMGIMKVRGSKVGTVFVRGVSGGERRRVTIAVELVTDPAVLFLDEPTSGLDSTASFKVVECLKSSAQHANRTVIATIHQPASSTYELFDKLYLLVSGQTAYFGPLANAVDHFKSLGMSCPEFSNPADFFLDQMNVDFWKDRSAAEVHIKQIADGFKNSQADAQATEEIKMFLQKHSEGVPVTTYANNWLRQTAILFRRNLMDAIFNPLVYWVRAVMYVAMAILMGTCWYDIGYNQDSVENRLGAFFFAVAFLCFMSVAGIPAIIEDKANFEKERANGAYGVASYVLANTLVGIPFIFLIAVIYTVIAYWLIMLNPSVGAFFRFMLYLFMALYTVESIVQIISALLPVFVAALAITAFVNGFFMCVQGYFINFSQLPTFWIWGHYWGYQTYAFDAMVHSDFTGLTFDCEHLTNTTCFCIYQSTTGDPCTFSGEDVLSFLGYADVNEGLWMGIVAIQIVVYRIILYLILRFKISIL